MNNNTKYQLFLDMMRIEISELVGDVFVGEDDPEYQWKYFRSQLKHWKREQTLRWGLIDDNDEPKQ